MGARILGLLLTAALALAPVFARAEGEPACTAPSELTRAEFELPHLARALRDKTPTTILVVNSSAKPKAATGTDAAPRRFSSYVEEGLRIRYPNGGVRVLTRNEPGFTAPDLAAALPGILAETRPALVIWQTGTHDAIRGVDLDSFARAVGNGIAQAQAANADVLVMSPQYSPRTEFAFDASPYNSTLRWVSRTNDALFFDRYALMRYWADEDIFDLDEWRPDPALFDNVHRCIGRLVTTMIVNGVTPKTVGSR
ncbi:SGNH/GDSL hydrolase family protein [Ancylobacter terrae]|uniref:SGNH/GDSL hydrolase family protein n=1 Tax=Ancylobacter sp. sgz301288 TaxID=3342077 RepID=UPI00385ECD41